VTLPWDVPENGQDEDHANPPWVRYPVEVGNRVVFVGDEKPDSPLVQGEEGVILHFNLDPVHPYVYVDWDRSGTGGVPLSEVRNVDDGPE
jgi:hypothetical protein